MKQNKVYIDNREYSCKSLARHYNLSYSRVYRLYHKGYRGEKLLQSAQEDRSILINGQRFKSKNAAASYFQIPATTFYRRFNAGTLNVTKQQRRKD